MPAEGHALLSASSSHRWLACPPSVRLEEPFPDTAGEAAAEGTLAHAIVEEKLNRIIAGLSPGKASTKLREHPLYKPVMEEHTDEYIGYVMDLWEDAKEQCNDAILLSEQRLDYSPWAPSGFGTGDTLIIADGECHVIDFKYGKGVPVSAEDNPQLRLYGLGLWNAYHMLYDIRHIQCHIVQPRLESNSSEYLPVGRLLSWGEMYAKPRAQLAWRGEGEFNPGDHCRFCKARGVCRARAQRQLELARYEFRDAPLLTNQEIGEILGRVDELANWAKSVKDYAHREAVQNGAGFDGWKVVKGRSNRKLIDEAEAFGRLEDAGYSLAGLIRLKGLTELEEIIGKQQLAEILDGLIVKPEGKPTLVREDDARPAINMRSTAADDFEEA